MLFRRLTKKGNNVFWYSLFTGLILLFTNVYIADAQQNSILEQQRKKLLKEIELTTKLLKKTQISKEAALDRYITLQKQIKKRERLISNLKKEILATNKSITRSQNVITSLQEDIERLQNEYAQLARNAYRHQLSNSSALFIFSSRSFNEAFRRWQYIRQYDAYRKKQAKLIQETQNRLGKKINDLEKKKHDKVALLGEQSNQRNILSQERDTRNNIYKDLKKDESRLKSDLAEQQKAHAELKAAVESVIYAETEVINANSKNPAIAEAPANPSTRLSENEMTSHFKNTKGSLPWPVKDGIVTKHFGKQAHPTLKKIQITNNGIDLRTEEDTEVRAIFTGEVSGIQFIPGYSNTLILKHGEYFTVYSNLEEVYVEKGDWVEGLQTLGLVSRNRKTQTSEMHFEVWRKKTRLNPIDWLKR